MYFPVSTYRPSSAPVIPTPEVGVCTPYPIDIPVTTNLVCYGSCFNSCDSFTDIAGSTTVTTSGDVVRNTTDLSSSGNPMANLSDSFQAAEILDDGSGDVYWQDSRVTTFRAWSPDISWRWNTDVKTGIFLCYADDVTSSIQTRICGHSNLVFRINGSNLSCFAGGIGGNFDSSLSPTSGTWFVYSMRTDGNIVLSLDKSHEEVSASMNTPSGDFSVWSSVTSPSSAKWVGRIRDVAFYSESLSDANVDTMVDYMKDKWGL